MTKRDTRSDFELFTSKTSFAARSGALRRPSVTTTTPPDMASTKMSRAQLSAARNPVVVTGLVF